MYSRIQSGQGFHKEVLRTSVSNAAKGKALFRDILI